MTIDICGPTSGELFAVYDPVSRCLKTSQAIGAAGSQTYSGTVPKTGSMSGGYLYEHPTPEHHTNASDCFSLLPTPQARDANAGPAKVVGGLRPSGQPRQVDLITVAARILSEGWGVYDSAVLWWEMRFRPAPCAVEPNARGNPQLSARFDEWLMGLPDGWVTEVVPRKAALKLLGNGVIPQQAMLALEYLTL